MHNGKGRLATIVAVGVLMATGLGACGSSDDDSGTTTGGAATSAATTQTTDAGGGKPLVAAADPSLLPYNFHADGSEEWEGINVDIAAALSKQLGRPVELRSAPFDSIIPGLQAGRYDLALTGMFDTKDREKVVDFVDYLKAKNDFLLRADDTTAIGSLEDLCGVHVGLPKGALEIQLVEDQSKTCEKDGKKPVELDVFPDLNAATLGLLSGRVDTVPNDSAANAYLVRENDGKLKTTGAYLAEGYFAAGVPKDSENLQPLQKAFQALIDSGQLKQILTKWGIADRMPQAATINNAAF